MSVRTRVWRPAVRQRERKRSSGASPSPSALELETLELDRTDERRDERRLKSLQSDEADARIESRVCGLVYSSCSRSNSASMPCESGLRSGEMAASSPVYLMSKLETSSSGSSSLSG